MKQGSKIRVLPRGITVMLLVAAATMWVREGRDFWCTPDQQAQRLLDAGNTKAAADSFADPNRRAVAQFRAGDFKASASTFAGLPDQDAMFNQATARVMLGEYDKAIELYDRVLGQFPERKDALINRDIAAGRAERTKDVGGDMTGGMLGADEIVFDDTPNNQGSDEVETQDKGLSDEEMQLMWLRQVQTTPSDFLRTKFSYQASHQDPAPEVPVDE